ncbi:serine/threonine protein kinase [Candidatus Woesearchaeota archaeon]|nr:serine/threonine protein kinase [Candidatus Woesearchaeota archaeon]MBW3016704.1 serine/threonine protein kinase [Candidatus Woesearchaeota archaeon]
MNDLLPGMRLGAYEIISKLGAGGMSCVYKAHKDGAPVALKVISLSETASLVDSLRWEAEIGAKIGFHSNLVEIRDYAESEGLGYLCMEFIDGNNVDDIIMQERIQRKEKIGIRLALGIARDVALGLQHMHDRNIIHRDVKPTNLLLNDRVKLFDYGIAFDLDRNLPKSREGIIMGTEGFIPFEYFQSNDSHPPGDVFSLGISLYLMLAKKVPFRDDHDWIQELHYNYPHKTDFLREKSVPEPVQAVCLKAIEKCLDNRYRSAAEFAEDLDRLLDNL